MGRAAVKHGGVGMRVEVEAGSVREEEGREVVFGSLAFGNLFYFFSLHFFCLCLREVC
jgi:hypothetical protein